MSLGQGQSKRLSSGSFNLVIYHNINSILINDTVLLLKIRHGNINIRIQHSIRVRILFPFIADDLCRKLETIFGKGCRKIRRAELLEKVRCILLL
jgi:hypothetical protein